MDMFSMKSLSNVQLEEKDLSAKSSAELRGGQQNKLL